MIEDSEQQQPLQLENASRFLEIQRQMTGWTTQKEISLSLRVTDTCQQRFDSKEGMVLWEPCVFWTCWDERPLLKSVCANVWISERK